MDLLRNRARRPVGEAFLPHALTNQQNPSGVPTTDGLLNEYEFGNSYGYVGAQPQLGVDPTGLYSWIEFFDDVGHVAAGFADTLTFGLTDTVRNALGFGDAINKCSEAYRAGELLELGAEVALTGGAAALKFAAKRALRRAVRSAADARIARLIASGKLKTFPGSRIHHTNPLFGHPGNIRTLFPTGGLPAWMHTNRFTLRAMTQQAHKAQHQYLRRLETLGMYVVNPPATTVRWATSSWSPGGP